MMRNSAGSVLVLCIPMVSGCFQKLDQNAASEGATIAVSVPGSPSGAPFKILLDTPQIGVTANPEGDPIDETTNPCDKVKHDALAVRTTNCAGCHDGPSAPGSPLTFILDDNSLATMTSSSNNYMGQRYVVPGNPEGSLLYKRAVIVRDMPPAPSDIRNMSNQITISDASILREWILNCMGPSTGGGAGGATGTTTGGAGGTSGATGSMTGSADASADGPRDGGGTTTTGAGGAPADAGTAGTGGAGGSGGSAGTGGAAGAGGGGATPCAGLCMNPTVFSVPPTYTNNNLGNGAVCLETTSNLTAWMCTNLGGRSFSINGQRVVNGNANPRQTDCTNVPTPAMTTKRNGGYCFQASGGGQAAASFSAN
jgi:hypothetical protein